MPADDLIFENKVLDSISILKKAFSLRRDYVKAKNEIESKDIKLVMKKNNMWPEIDLELSIARNGLDQHFSDAMEEVGSENNSEYFLGLAIRLPIENREAKSEYNKAKIEKAKSLLSFKKIERQIFVEINDRVRDCNILAERVKRQRDVLKIQEEKLNEELKSYKYGRSDTDTVIRYQNDLLYSQLLYAQSLLDYKVARINLSLSENSLLNEYFENII